MSESWEDLLRALIALDGIQQTTYKPLAHFPDCIVDGMRSAEHGAVILSVSGVRYAVYLTLAPDEERSEVIAIDPLR